LLYTYQRPGFRDLRYFNRVWFEERRAQATP
jgi:hypothetical protein